MTIKQAKRKYGVPGTKKSRKQWSVAIRNGKTPNKHLLEREEVVIETTINIEKRKQKILDRILKKVHHHSVIKFKK